MITIEENTKAHVKVFRSMFEAYRNLDKSSISILTMLLQYISEDGLLKRLRGNSLDNQAITEVTGISDKTISKAMSDLVDNNILFRVKLGKRYNYIANPQYLEYSGNLLSPWRKDHAKYLASEQWKEKRIQTLTRDEYTCQQCGTQESLQVHHLTYANFKNEPLEDLVTLCSSCHSKIHNKCS